MLDEDLEDLKWEYNDKHRRLFMLKKQEENILKIIYRLEKRAYDLEEKIKEKEKINE